MPDVCDPKKSSCTPAQLFIRDGVVDCTQVEFEDVAWCEALSDSCSPGLVDDAEYLAAFHGREMTREFREPIVGRLFQLAEATEDWCLLPEWASSCGEDRREAAQEFLTFLTRPCLLAALSHKSKKELLPIARKMAENEDDPKISRMGRAAVDLLALYSNKDSAPFQFPFSGDIMYVGAAYALRTMPGMEGPSDYWRAVYSHPRETTIFSPRFSKRSVEKQDNSAFLAEQRAQNKSDISIKFNTDHRIQAYQDELNAKLGCTSSKDEQRFTNGWRCEAGRDVDYYTYMQGKREEIRAAAARYSRWRPHLEAIFLKHGLPPYLASIAVIESKMRTDIVAPGSGAAGPYQIMPKMGPEYGLTIDKERGIDERRNVIYAAEAAAKILKQARRAILGEGFVPGLDIDEGLANIMSTSAYHAGVGNLRRAMRKAKKALEKQRAEAAGEKKAGPDPVTAEKVFSFMLSSKFTYRRYRHDSKDYPPQLYAAMEAVDRIKFKEMELVEQMVDVSISNFKKPVSLAQIAALTVSGAERLRELNPQFDEAGFDRVIKAGGSVRFLLPQAELCRVQTKLVDYHVVEKGDIDVTVVTNPPDLVPAIVDILEKDPYAILPNSQVSYPDFITMNDWY